MTSIDWSRLFTERKEIQRRFGEIWDLPVAKRYHTVLSRLGSAGTAMLEVGAGDRGLEGKMRAQWGGIDYKSCDIDSTHNHDFARIDDVVGEFDLVCAFELIEHLELEEAYRLVSECHRHTVAGGRIALTTPNIYYPPDYLRDATHKTPFCYDELGGLLSLAGYRVTGVYRLYHDAVLKKFVRRVLCYPLFRVMNIDFARKIMVVAEKAA